MRFAIYEDEQYRDLFPLTLLRPVFELVCGRESLRRRLQRWFPRADWGVRVRSELRELYSEEFPEARVNDPNWPEAECTLLVDGRWVPDRQPEAAQLQAGTAGFCAGQLAWIVLASDALRLLADDCFTDALDRVAASCAAVDAGGTMVSWPWDLISRNAEQLQRDFQDQGISQWLPGEHVQLLGEPGDVYVSETAQLDPYVVIDARSGPVSIDGDVRIQSFTRIEGPCHIGRGSRLFRASVRGGTTIGAECRVGGEIEESILHGQVNKYHDGFLGHSYLCPWVNIGAMSTTSDLKNDYSNVFVPVNGELTDTGLTKVGSFIGDHSKTAIDSMFNTGSTVGVMSLVLPGGRLLPRHIPSFCNVNFGLLTTDVDLDGSIAAARTAMGRRSHELTECAEQLLRNLYRQTEAERARAVQRSLQRRLKA